MSCDEHVIHNMGQHIKRSYSTSLLTFAVNRSTLPTGNPLAFGEIHVKARIKNILNYRQPPSWIVVGTMLVVVALVIGCTTDPKPLQSPSRSLYSGYPLEQLMENKTLYISDISKVSGLINAMPMPNGLEGQGIALQTTTQPYGLTINYIMNDSTEIMKDGAISAEAFYPHSILLFYLIDNVGQITYSIVENTGQYDGATYTFSFTREQIGDLVGDDVRNYSADETTLKQLIDRVDELPFHRFGREA